MFISPCTNCRLVMRGILHARTGSFLHTTDCAQDGNFLGSADIVAVHSFNQGRSLQARCGRAAAAGPIQGDCRAAKRHDPRLQRQTLEFARRENESLESPWSVVKDVPGRTARLRSRVVVGRTHPNAVSRAGVWVCPVTRLAVTLHARHIDISNHHHHRRDGSPIPAAGG